MREKAKELWITAGLLILALATLFGLHGQPSTSRGADLLTKIAFAVLVTVVEIEAGSRLARILDDQFESLWSDQETDRQLLSRDGEAT